MLQILLSMLVSFMKFIKLQMKKKVRGRGKENVQPAQLPHLEKVQIIERINLKE